jgi:hypothetical protein
VNWVVAKPFTADRISELVREINGAGGGAPQSSLATAAA